MKKIIVATDFSESATNAVLYATDLAVTLDADLVLLHVYHLPQPVSEIPVVVDTAKEISKAKEGLDELKYQLGMRINNVIDIHTMVPEGSFFMALERLCKEIQPYLVVLGSQGTTALDRMIMGSHVIHAMKHLQWPVLAVAKDTNFEGIHKIGLACDLHDVGTLIPAEKLNKLVSDLKAELHVLNTGKAGVYDPELFIGSQQLIRLSNVKPEFHFLTNEDTDEGIVDFANKIKIDLLIVLPRKHGFIYQLLHRSHTKYMTMHSNVPVLALHQIQPTNEERIMEESKVDINDIM